MHVDIGVTKLDGTDDLAVALLKEEDAKTRRPAPTFLMSIIPSRGLVLGCYDMNARAACVDVLLVVQYPCGGGGGCLIAALVK